jgi:uncharacterized protein (TIGR03435 family)
MDLRSLIQYAYALQDLRWVKGDDPLLEKRFDIEARAGADVERTPRGVSGPFNVMLRSLLAERFKLAVRWEDQEHSVYVLSRARDDGTLGPGLRPTTCPPPESSPAPEGSASGAGPARLCGSSRTTNGVMDADGVTMLDVALGLTLSFDRPVFDRTELRGRFDIDTKFDMADLPFYAGRLTGPGPSSHYPSFYTALRDDLGLKLEPRRERVPLLVVEHVEAPTEN